VRFLVLTQVYGVEKIFIHHRLMVDYNGDAEPYIAAPAVGWFSRILGNARFVRSLDWHPNVQAHLLQAKDGRWVLVFWRVEAESLRMGMKDDRQLGLIESAPVDRIAGITDQKEVAVMKGMPPRATYFDPDRVVPREVRLNQMPTSATDFWGNAVTPSETWSIDEAPQYLFFDHDPSDLRGVVTQGRAPAEPSLPALISSNGKLIRPTRNRTVQVPANITEQFFGVLNQIPNRSLQRPAESPTSEIQFNSNDTITWTITETQAGQCRLIIGVRSSTKESGGFTWPYQVNLNGSPIKLEPWGGWPESVRRRGGNWVEMIGYLLTQPLKLCAGDIVSITSSKNNARLYEMFMWPQH
jgi:hypothetical protein